MSKEIYISSTPHETRLAIVENDALTEIYYERENEYTLAGSIYNGRVTRVLPGMQSSFVDVGLERDAFLYITDFMEEAPDATEFDTSTNGDHGPRAPRVLEAPRTQEATARSSELRAPDGETNSRIESGARSADRGDRGGRSRRGGRDRHQERTTPPESPSQFTADRPHSDLVRSPAEDQPPSLFVAPPEDAEIGEGAPGADGSRRWRGRRGRRRGRGTPGQTSDEGTATTDANSSPNDDLPYDRAGTYEIDGAAEAGAPPVPAPFIPSPLVPAPREQSRSQPGQRAARNDNASREGGRRDDSRSETPRREHVQRPDQRPQRVPRGFAPSRDLYGVDSGESSATGPVAGAYEVASPAAEPIILPGESLSKYRKGRDEPAPPNSTSDAAPVTLSPPATLYTIAAGWDGGDTLPGETLSRRSSNEPSSSAPYRNASSSDNREGRSDGRPSRDGRNGGRRDGRQDARRENSRSQESPRQDFRRPEAQQNFAPPAQSARVIPDTDGPSVAETPEEQPEVARAGHTEQFAPEEIAYETSTPHLAEVVPEAIPDPIAAEALSPKAEYEPSEASASYRVDPFARSEYRQSGATLEPPLETIDVVEAAAPPSPEQHDPELLQSQPETHSLAHSITPAPGEPVAMLHSEDQLHSDHQLHPSIEPHPEPAEPALEAHDVTSISAEGDMFSESVEITPEPVHPTPMEVHAPSSPMQHEGAVVAPEHNSNAIRTSHVPAPSAGFVPGAGILDEEVMDDDDFSASTIHASSIEEMDYTEEETLEGAADLGTMLRDMSIDQLTRTSPEIGDDEDDSPEDFDEDEFDEDDLEEDEESDQQESDQSDELAAEEEDHEGYEIDDNPSLGESGDSEESRRSGSPADAEFFEAQFNQPNQPRTTDRGSGEAQSSASSPRRDSGRGGDGRNNRRDGRRDGRRGRNDRGDRSSDRPRSTGGSGDRERSGGNRRHSMQTTDLPAISDLLKPGQEILVQIAKEPIAKKGARITSHIALPGRFLVFMPTVNHTGVSRKIESDGERRRLKEILLSEKGDAAGGFIVRTAASGASEEELRSDLRFLLNLWSDIKQRSESSKSPALIYHDLNLIERILRDQVTDNFSAIWVDSETEYERVLRFLQRFQPALIRRVKLYTKETPLFEQFGITEEINKALRSKVWLKSGGSIVINQTEALVAIDINTGKFVGKTARLEDTIVKTNLDAIPEIVRQIRLRDLGGIIIIDFIDMDERKNRNKVMAALEEELKSDRAPSKVLQFNDFGLVAITRKRVKQSLERTLSTTCNVCVGTGMVKSPVTVCNDIYVEMKKMHKHFDRGDVMLRVHPEVVKQLKTSGSKWLQEMEEMAGKTILVKSDPSLHPEQFDIH